MELQQTCRRILARSTRQGHDRSRSFPQRIGRPMGIAGNRRSQHDRAAGQGEQIGDGIHCRIVIRPFVAVRRGRIERDDVEMFVDVAKSGWITRAGQKEHHIGLASLDPGHLRLIPPDRYGRPLLSLDFVAIFASQRIIALADMYPHDGAFAHCGKTAFYGLSQMRHQTQAAGGFQIQRSQLGFRSFQRPQDDFAASQLGEQCACLVIAHALCAQPRPQAHLATLCTGHAERIQLAPVKHDFMSIGLLQGKGIGQRFKAVGNADELVDINLGHNAWLEKYRIIRTIPVPLMPIAFEARYGRPQRILLVCTQRIGDVLLTTPLAHALKQAWPQARLEMLVLPGTAGVLEGNADIDAVLAPPQHLPWRARLRQLRALWNQYDLALSPLPTDRARLICRVAGRRSLGLLQSRGEASKRWLLTDHLLFDDLDTHTVSMGLRLAERLGIKALPKVVTPGAPWPPQRPELDAQLDDFSWQMPYAVLHPYPKFRYKMWSSAGWRELMHWLQAQGLQVVLSGGPESAEIACATTLASASSQPVLNLAGQLSLAEGAELIRRAALYVGPDTAMSHIAAATGTPTVVLFGPSNPVKWGPWPAGWQTLTSPWARVGSARQGNVYLVQGRDPRGCVPCLQEGCERHLNSHSACLDVLSAQRVIAAAATMLGLADVADA